MRLLFLLAAAGLLAAAPPAPTPRREFRPAAGAATVAVFSPAGHLLGLAGPNAPTVGVYETRTGLLLRSYAGHEQPVLDVAFAPGPDTAVSADASGLVRAWNPENVATLQTWQAPAPVRFVRFVPGSARVVLVAGSQAWVWNLRHPTTAPVPLRLAWPAKARPSAAAISADGQRLALGFDTGQTLVQALSAKAGATLALASTPIQDLYFGRDTLYAAAGTPQLLRWVPTAAAPVAALPLPAPLVSVEADGPDHLAALGFATGQAAVWHLGRNEPTYTCQAAGAARGARFQPQAGGLLMAAYEGQSVRTWKVW